MEIAAKRSQIEFGQGNSQKSIFFLSVAHGSLGQKVKVNFDAELRDQALQDHEYEEIYDIGFSWSETFQSSSIYYDADSKRIKHLLEKFGSKLSINLVIGNEAYGFKPNFDSLAKSVRELPPKECRQIKLGAEGKVYGKKVIDLAREINATPYILHTRNMIELLEYASSRKISSSVYTLCRISGSKFLAISEIASLKEGYFKRRGVEFEEISKNIGNFAVYGTKDEVAEQICELLDLGAGKVVLCPVFNGIKEMQSQMRELGRIVA